MLENKRKMLMLSSDIDFSNVIVGESPISAKARWKSWKVVKDRQAIYPEKME